MLYSSLWGDEEDLWLTLRGGGRGHLCSSILQPCGREEDNERTITEEIKYQTRFTSAKDAHVQRQSGAARQRQIPLCAGDYVTQTQSDVLQKEEAKRCDVSGTIIICGRTVGEKDKRRFMTTGEKFPSGHAAEIQNQKSDCGASNLSYLFLFCWLIASDSCRSPAPPVCVTPCSKIKKKPN